MVAVVSLPVAGAWYVFQIEGRMRTVEAQIQALATQPQSQSDTSVDGTAASNALSEACTEVYRRAAEFHAKRLKSAEAAMNEILKKLGCGGGGGGG
jgi:hypothetical protein